MTDPLPLPREIVDGLAERGFCVTIDSANAYRTRGTVPRGWAAIRALASLRPDGMTAEQWLDAMVERFGG